MLSCPQHQDKPNKWRVRTTTAAKITTKHHQIGIAYLQCITECTSRTSSRHLWPPINAEGQKKFQGHYQQKTRKSSKSKNKQKKPSTQHIQASSNYKRSPQKEAHQQYTREEMTRLGLFKVGFKQ